ncbi:sulfotransferase family 2 domain-containing protein [Thermodesulfobacteriota bacterium]
MLISHTHKFIFIHIYKTAGMSIRNEFVPYSRLIDRLAYEYGISKKVYWKIIHLMGWVGNGMKQFTGYHKHSKAWEVKEKLGSNIFDSYYKFSFVRNPFDLTVSQYFFILQIKKLDTHKKVSRMNFSEYLKWHLSRNPPLQIDFLMNRSRDRRLVDYIGRFETLVKDVDIIKKNLNLEVTGSTEHRNPSIKRQSKSYKDYYDNESKNLLFDYFQQDFEMLGYNFDGFQENMRLIEQF